MRSHALKSLALCMMAVTATGCGFAFSKRNVTAQGVRPMIITGDSFQKIDLARELNPASPGLKEDETAEAASENRRILRAAFEAFYKDPFEQLQRRNRAQERLLAASNERCGEYKAFLKQIDAETNLILGSLTTAVAGAGAIVTGAATARALAGIAGILTGMRAEFNEDYFHNKTIQVITDGLEAKRKETYEKMLDARKLDMTGYPVEAAVKDAITYHAECSLIAGLEHAALSIERAQNPGLQGAEKALIQARRLQSIMEAKASDLFPLGVAQPLVGTSLAAGGIDLLRGATALGGAGPLETYAASRRQVAHLAAELTKRIEALKAEEKKPDSKIYDALATRVKTAGDYADAVLRTQLAAAAAAHDSKLRAIEVEIVATIDVAKRADRQSTFADELLKATPLISEITRLILAFRTAFNRAEVELQDKDKPSLDARIAAADERLRRLISDLVERRSDYASRLVAEASADAAGKLEAKLKAAVDKEGQKNIAGLLRARQQDLQKNVDDRDKFNTSLDDFEKVFKEIGAAIKEVLAKDV